jgi:glycosyltransferase involved in cell wall biosynthesis
VQGEIARMDNGAEPSLSVVLPVYNEVGTIEDLIRALIGVLEKSDREFEIIVVDDGSDDETGEILSKLREKYSRAVRVARHIYNRGNGAALRTGIQVSENDVIVTMDADGQHAPEDVLKLVAEIPPYDLVIGARTAEYEGGWHRNLANRFYNRFASWLSQYRVEDLTSGFRAMRRSAVIHFLPLFPSGFSAPTTTTLTFLKAGYNVKFLPVHVGKRQAGESKISIWADGSRFIMIIFRMIMLYDPLRIFVPTSIVLGLLGILAGIAGIVEAKRLVIANSAILFLISGLLTWLLGLLASQISSTLIQYHGDETIILE